MVSATPNVKVLEQEADIEKSEVATDKSEKQEKFEKQKKIREDFIAQIGKDEKEKGLYFKGSQTDFNITKLNFIDDDPPEEKTKKEGFKRIQVLFPDLNPDQFNDIVSTSAFQDNLRKQNISKAVYKRNGKNVLFSLNDDGKSYRISEPTIEELEREC
jgi:hypothetical protein